MKSDGVNLVDGNHETVMLVIFVSILVPVMSVSSYAVNLLLYELRLLYILPQCSVNCK